MAYTTINKSGSHFKAKIYTGNGSTNTAQTGVGFQPDWTWIKERSSTSSNILTDAVRGANKSLSSNLTSAESTETQSLISFDSDGFTVGSGGGVNENSQKYVSWNWKANGQGSANTDGSTNTTYTSANTTAGISIVKWTPSGSAETVGHGLGAVPKVIITKNLGASQGWFTYHHSIGNTKYLLLNDTAVEATDSTAWNNTTPTSSVFSVGSQFGGNPYIAYCFAEKIGFSKFGLYEGNDNVDGPFVYTGFKPAFIMLRGKGIARNWTNWDNARDIYNPLWNYIYPNLSSTGTNITPGSNGSFAIDFCSNGFKLRNTDDKFNGSGQGYIYMAFAEAPLVGSNNVPCTAR
jgi:hypothetical protein